MTPHSCSLLKQHDFSPSAPDNSAASIRHALLSYALATAESSSYSISSSILAVSPIRSSKMLSASCIFSWASADAVPLSMEADACTQHDEVTCMSGMLWGGSMMR